MFHRIDNLLFDSGEDSKALFVNRIMLIQDTGKIRFEGCFVNLIGSHEAFNLTRIDDLLSGDGAHVPDSLRERRDLLLQLFDLLVFFALVFGFVNLGIEAVKLFFSSVASSNAVICFCISRKL